jgi:hypothetical protein
MVRWVEIEFDCLPLRTVTRLDVPLDASPRYRQFCERVKAALEKHGSHNTYYLHQASCKYHLLNCETRGTIEFDFEGTALTDSDDQHCLSCDLQVRLARETCDWLNENVVKWFSETVNRSVAIEFDHYIQAGDLSKTIERIELIQKASDESGGYLGMYL